MVWIVFVSGQQGSIKGPHLAAISPFIITLQPSLNMPVDVQLGYYLDHLLLLHSLTAHADRDAKISFARFIFIYFARHFRELRLLPICLAGCCPSAEGVSSNPHVFCRFILSYSLREVGAGFKIVKGWFGGQERLLLENRSILTRINRQLLRTLQQPHQIIRKVVPRLPRLTAIQSLNKILPVYLLVEPINQMLD